MPEAGKRAILDLLARHGVPLIEDDVYGDITFGEARARPFSALGADGRAEVLYCGSFSKTLAPGYRIGWLVPGRRMPVVLEHKLALTLSGPALPQAAVTDFLAEGGYDKHLRRLRRTFRETVDRMRRTVELSFPAGTRASRPQGGFVLWVELPERIEIRALLGRALALGICFAPGDVFTATDRYRNCLRLSCGFSWDERVEAGVTALGRLACEAARD